MTRLLAVLLSVVTFATAAQAQTAPDYSSVNGIMTELYAAVTRKPGAPFEWHRLRAIMAPEGMIVPQRAQTQGQTRVLNAESFIAWIDEGWRPVIGTPRDQGFYERQTNLIVEEFGDIAHAFTTYEKGPYEPRRVQATGINSVQLIKRDGRWYILSITWDEENASRRLPDRYRGK